MALSKRELFLKRRLRNRNKLRAINSGRPRLSVHRSSKNISVQVIDDVQGITLASASTMEAAVRGAEGDKTAKAAKVGELIAERSKAAGIENVVFDRAGNKYHGRIAALADAAREAGLGF